MNNQIDNTSFLDMLTKFKKEILEEIYKTDLGVKLRAIENAISTFSTENKKSYSRKVCINNIITYLQENNMQENLEIDLRNILDDTMSEFIFYLRNIIKDNNIELNGDVRIEFDVKINDIIFSKVNIQTTDEIRNSL